MKYLAFISTGASLVIFLCTVAIWGSVQGDLREAHATTAALAKAVGQAFVEVDGRVSKLEPKKGKK